jgi:hypothetical protein
VSSAIHPIRADHLAQRNAPQLGHPQSNSVLRFSNAPARFAGTVR